MGKPKVPGFLQPRNGRDGPPWRVALCVAGKVHWFGARTEPALKQFCKVVELQIDHVRGFYGVQLVSTFAYLALISSLIWFHSIPPVHLHVKLW